MIADAVAIIGTMDLVFGYVLLAYISVYVPNVRPSARSIDKKEQRRCGVESVDVHYHKSAQSNVRYHDQVV